MTSIRRQGRALASGGRVMRLTPAQRARIEHELNGCPYKPEGPQPGREYVTTQQAMAIVGSSGNQTTVFFPLPKVKCGKRPASGKRPYLYRRQHIERVAQVKREARIGLKSAVRVVAAEIEGRI